MPEMPIVDVVMLILFGSMSGGVTASDEVMNIAGHAASDFRCDLLVALTSCFYLAARENFAQSSLMSGGVAFADDVFIAVVLVVLLRRLCSSWFQRRQTNGKLDA